jgi:hypothetical protein
MPSAVFPRRQLGCGRFRPFSMMDATFKPTWQVPTPFGYRMGPGMMRFFRGNNFGSTPDNYGFPMGPGMMGGGYGGMMGGYGSGGPSPVEPLSLDQAKQAVSDYLAGLGNSDLELKEVMIFDNHAYAEIVEKSTGIGAMEVLVDPVTLAVYPEHGPNMMWNLKYGMMGRGYGGMMGMMGRGYGGMMGMMGGYPRQPGNTTTAEASAKMPVTPEQAIEAAPALPGSIPPEPQSRITLTNPRILHLHILRDGKTIGMLSVNGYSSQVFPHTWHGNFIEMSEEE